MLGLIRQHTGRHIRLVAASHVMAKDAAYRTHTRHTHVQWPAELPFVASAPDALSDLNQHACAYRRPTARSTSPNGATKDRHRRP